MNIDKKYKNKYSEYQSIHIWLYYHFGKANRCDNPTCKCSNPKRYEWSLIRGKKLEKNRDNFQMFCKSCHYKYDLTIKTRKKIGFALSNRCANGLVGNHAKKVIQLDKNNNIINQWLSLTQASKSLGILVSSIANCLTNRSKSAGGFLWKYPNTNN